MTPISQPLDEAENGSDAPRSPTVQSVERAFQLLAELNRRAVSSIDQLHRDTGLPKATIVRLLKTLVEAGYVSNDRRQGGYQVTAQVNSLSCGFHGDPLVVEAARPWAVALTRQHKWPVAVAILNRDAVAVRFSTIPDSRISPFHATLNMRLSLVTRALGLAYLAFCPDDERGLLLAMARETDDAFTRCDDAWIDWTIQRTRHRGFAERDPGVEPKNSGTIAVPIMSGQGVIATLGMTYFKVAVSEPMIVDELAPLLQDTAKAIENQILSIGSALSTD